MEGIKLKIIISMLGQLASLVVVYVVTVFGGRSIMASMVSVKAL